MRTLNDVMASLTGYQKRLVERRASELMRKAKQAKKRSPKKLTVIDVKPK